MSQSRVPAVITPLVVVAIAFSLAWVSNQRVYIGPIDRATFGWLVVIPLWCAAPTFAGFAWRGFPASGRTRYALLAGLIVGGVAAILIWWSAASPFIGCTPTRTPIELVPPALMVGAVIGGGLFVGCWAAAREIAAMHIGRGAIYGAVIQLLVIPAAGTLMYLEFFGMCQRS